jgi:hypothetical protein
LTQIKLMNIWYRSSPRRWRIRLYCSYRSKNTKRKYCFLTTSSVSVTILYTFTFAYSMLSVIDKLLTYINLCIYHWIMLNIEPDFGSVKIMDSLQKDGEQYQIRGNFNHYRTIPVSFIHFLRYQVLPPIGNKCRQFCTSLVQSLY